MSARESRSIDLSHQHKAEIDRGERFEFGKNWARFLSTLNDDRITIAKQSLTTFLGAERLDGKLFLDVGSGSGLFSLAARMLGAKVRSLDYDPHSFACTGELKRRYFPDDPDWIVEQGSALDTDYLAGLGTYDIVYSWGVLHHTGQMWQALANVKPLVRMNGQLFISIYNDLGVQTDYWASIKRTYNALPRPLSFMFAVGIIGMIETRALLGHLRQGNAGDWLRQWTQYKKSSGRGMSRWHDWIDWIGGWPYERATVEQVSDFYARDGFQLAKVIERDTGCNEFVFRRIAPFGVFVDPLVPAGSSAGRRHGQRVKQWASLPEGWTGTVDRPDALRPPATLWLLAGDRIAGQPKFDNQGRIVMSGHATPADPLFVVAGELRPLDGPFRRLRGRMWQAAADDLVGLADGPSDGRRSPVFVFEDGRQLAYPHADHSGIRRYGGGRFSHWGGAIHFSSSDNSNPNSNGRRYQLLICRE